MLPTQQLLEKVSKEIKRVPNRQGEHLRKIHYGCYLLCHKSGLRVSEAVSFDLANKVRRGLYRIEKSKGKKDRLVYIPKKVIRELKKHNWKPNQTNRWNFYHFLKKIKRELGIGRSVELTPHTLRHGFATYQAEFGLPLPILQKLLGHSSIRTTALYWQNIYQEPDNEVGPILAGKKWLESREPPKPPITENFPEIPRNSEPLFIDQKPLIPNKKPIQQYNSLSTPKLTKKTSGISTNEISPRTSEKFFLNTVSKKSDQLKTNQPLPLTANQEQNPTKKELILLQKIQVLEKENNNLKQLVQQEKELSAKQKQRADNYQQQLTVIVNALKQWQKINYYKQLEKELKAQIEQPLFKLPNK